MSFNLFPPIILLYISKVVWKGGWIGRVVLLGNRVLLSSRVWLGSRVVLGSRVWLGSRVVLGRKNEDGNEFVKVVDGSETKKEVLH